ncbi:hypothetical protein [Nocardia asteroides]|uniref:hypothetical protein n=1 Tax=Nocardia asteroides TaxID=1824 RepID=UPI003438D699
MTQNTQAVGTVQAMIAHIRAALSTLITFFAAIAGIGGVGVVTFARGWRVHWWVVAVAVLALALIVLVGALRRAVLAVESQAAAPATEAIAQMIVHSARGGQGGDGIGGGVGGNGGGVQIGSLGTPPN